MIFVSKAPLNASTANVVSNCTVGMKKLHEGPPTTTISFPNPRHS
jgi:hypothetical protein